MYLRSCTQQITVFSAHKENAFTIANMHSKIIIPWAMRKCITEKAIQNVNNFNDNLDIKGKFVKRVPEVISFPIRKTKVIVCLIIRFQ